MAATSKSGFWPITWFVVTIFVVPFGLAYLLFDVNRFEIGVFFALIGLLVWLLANGAGMRAVSKDTAVILKDSLDNYTAHPGRPYLYIPIVHRVEAVLPTYPLTFEMDIKDIDTCTPKLAKIGKITVRATCQITNPEMFYDASRSYINDIRRMEEDEKLKRTDIALWQKLLDSIAHVILDDTTRDVVWKWKLYLQDSGIVDALDYKPIDEQTGAPKLEGDPYSLSQNRKSLGDRVKAAVKTKLEQEKLGFRINPLVLESIEIDAEIIKGATANRNKEREKAIHDASLEAAAILEKGGAEADVRAKSLAAILDVLINKHEIPHTDELISQVVRASLYSDGEMIWKGVLTKSAGGDGKSGDGKGGDGKGGDGKAKPA